MTHRCHATGCGTPVAPKLFMCLRHWRILPKRLRDAIWTTYRPGQENDKQPSAAYLQNAREAIRWLEVYEDLHHGRLTIAELMA